MIISFPLSLSPISHAHTNAYAQKKHHDSQNHNQFCSQIKTKSILFEEEGFKVELQDENDGLCRTDKGKEPMSPRLISSCRRSSHSYHSYYQ